MKFIGFKELKEIERDNSKLANKALLKSGIVAATIVAVLVVLAPVFEENVLFISLIFGFGIFFSSYTTTMYEIKLLKKAKLSDEEIDNEVNQSKKA